MPFAGYKDFAACVAANKSKDNPKAYCASIERKIIGKTKMAKKAAAGRKRSHNYSKEAIAKAREA